ncbi:hypothetical protein ACFQH6_19315 [Halobacteriaceae archaeon GCM10025711]
MASAESRITVRTDGSRANTLVEGDDVAVLVAWDTRTTTKSEVRDLLEEAARELDHEVEATVRIPATDGGTGGDA